MVKKLSSKTKKQRTTKVALGDLPNSTSRRWSLDVQPMPVDVDVARLCECLVVMDGSGLLRTLQLLEAPTREGEVATAAQNAFLDPSPPLTPSKPQELVVNRPELQLALASLASAVGFAIIVDETLDLSPVIAGLAAKIGSVSEATITGAPYPDEARLARAVARFAATAPWRFVNDDFVYEIICEDRPLSLPFGVILGSAGVIRGLALYPSLASIRAVQMVNESDGRAKPRRGKSNQKNPALPSPVDCISMLLGTAAEVDEVALGAFSRRALAVHEGLYPTFIEVSGDEGRPLTTPSRVDDFELALHAIAGHFERAVTRDVYAFPARTSVPLPLSWREADVVVHRINVPEAPVLDFDHYLTLCHLDPRQVAWAKSFATIEGNARLGAGLDAQLAVVVRATKEDAVRGAKAIAGSRRLAITFDPPGIAIADTVDDQRDFRLLAPCSAGFRDALTSAIIASGAPELLLLLVGGGTKRSAGTLDFRAVVAVFSLSIAGAEPAKSKATLFDPDEAFIFEVSLDGIEPRIWRRFTVPCHRRFGDLHQAIQAFGGWGNAHLYEFSAGSGRRPKLIASSDDDGSTPAAWETPLDDFFVDRRKRSCRYLYDFGDNWELTVKMVGIARSGDPDAHCELLDGARSFPPEDSGGIPGYDDCVAVANDPKLDPERAEWLGDWKPERFDRVALRRRSPD